MKDIVVHLKVEKYIKQWLEHTLGNPVRFPSRSYESEVLRRALRKQPQDIRTPILLCKADYVAIVIPDDDYKRPEYYNYLPVRGQRRLQAAIDGLFRIALWSDCAPLIHSKQELNAGIDKWCQQHGIELDYREAVRQKFYRLRKEFRIKGIILGKKYQKSLPR
ncbi:MAG: hypothetical protein IKO20_01595 [Bacteroidaceae bacterium]|nr:hypothetical protein [Bacteroidaceae bacterium]